jgi:hypothetical protein
MIYLVTYNETGFTDRSAKRLILVESPPGLEVQRVTNLVRMLTNSNVAAKTVEIAGQKDWDPTRIRHPAIRLYKLD